LGIRQTRQDLERTHDVEGREMLVETDRDAHASSI
jgi:hypothetical protein